MKSTLSLFAICVMILLLSCQYNKSDQLPDCATVPSSFNTNVLPLIHQKCATQCHNAFTTNKGGPLTNYSEIKNKAALVRHMVVTKQMPQIGFLTDAEIKMITCWVDGGALNN